MLVIAVAHGNGCDPFTTSATGPDYYDPANNEGLNIKDANACRDFICKEKDLEAEHIDEILVVYSSDYDEPPEVQHHYTEFD